jgi:hypothetical protein
MASGEREATLTETVEALRRPSYLAELLVSELEAGGYPQPVVTQARELQAAVGRADRETSP